METIKLLSHDDLPPAPQPKICEVCNKPMQYLANDEIPRILRSFSIACYRVDLSGHEVCQEEMLRIAEIEQRQAALEESERRFRDLIAKSGLTKSQTEKTFDKFKFDSETKEAANALKNWRKYDSGITLMGLPGVGKTHLMVAFSMMQISLGRRIRFYNFNELVGKFRQLSFQSMMVYEAELEKIKKEPILILDDIGAERGTPLSVDIFNGILEYRLNNNLPMFLTTNCSESDIVSKFHERAYSPLFQGSCRAS